MQDLQHGATFPVKGALLPHEAGARFDLPRIQGSLPAQHAVQHAVPFWALAHRSLKGGYNNDVFVITEFCPIPFKSYPFSWIQ